MNLKTLLPSVAIAALVIVTFFTGQGRNPDIDSAFPSLSSSNGYQETTSPALAVKQLSEPETAEITSLSTVRNIFNSIDPALVDDTLIKKKIEGASVNRYRIVEINTNILRAHMRAEKASQDIYLPLFDDLTIMGRPNEALEYTTGPRSGYGSWQGSVNGDGRSLLTIAIAPSGRTEIDIVSDQGNFRVSKINGTSYHIIIDANSTEPGAHDHPID